MGERTKASGKKRKVLADGSDLWARLGLSTQQDDNGPSSFGKHHQKVILHSDVYSRSDGQPFGKAKDCLLLLEKTIHNLHQKEQFPYNPKVLLRRLFQFLNLYKSQLVVYAIDKLGKHFVLVHVARHQGWSWYKVVTQLRSDSHRVTTKMGG